MRLDKTLLRGVATAACTLAMPLVLGGCFATTQDLEPIKSDISVLEKQFVELQRGQSAPRPAQQAAGTGATSSVSERRISGLEARVDNLEARLAGLDRSQATLSPQPITPEPVVVEPIGEAPVMTAPGPERAPSNAPAPVVVSPVQPSVTPERAEMDVDEMYKDAMTSFREGNYAEAEAGFARILQDYPDDRLADNAAYWLGEIYYSRKDYEKAIAVFRKIAKDYPVGDKVPDAVLKMGMAYDELGRNDKAKEAYNRIIDNYPYSDAARLARQRMGSSN